ncbi:hypothetical protein F8388_022092 [Cannabis sativa]|uniref:Uncharacterized protein n=1 Tax=Cannabis sativa TaxID=3483 RepID=A0A7J6G7P5_CANSA|nr:hypothetical protein F8388_022092 [Cannabis sativa]
MVAKSTFSTNGWKGPENEWLRKLTLGWKTLKRYEIYLPRCSKLSTLKLGICLDITDKGIAHTFNPTSTKELVKESLPPIKPKLVRMTWQNTCPC